MSNPVASELLHPELQFQLQWYLCGWHPDGTSLRSNMEAACVVTEISPQNVLKKKCLVISVPPWGTDTVQNRSTSFWTMDAFLTNCTRKEITVVWIITEYLNISLIVFVKWKTYMLTKIKRYAILWKGIWTGITVRCGLPSLWSPFRFHPFP